MKAEELWQEFCKERNIDIATEYEAWAFCGGGETADELADLVLERRKFGTASAYDEYALEGALDELPQIGEYSVIQRADGQAVCVIKTYDVYIRPFGDVPPFHAYSEGEGDRSLECWRDIHRKAFGPDLETLGMPLTEESRVVCEKFTVEYVAKEYDNYLGEDDLYYVEPSMEYAQEIAAYRQEMIDADSSFDGCFSMKRMPDIQEFVDYCSNWSNPRRPADSHGAWGNVIMCMRRSDNKMVGCMQVHNVLTERMERFTGHIGYSVRPSERRKGYATRMLAKAKDFLSSFGFEEAFVSCLPDNEGSKRTILANGGEYIETIFLEEDGVYLERYRLALANPWEDISLSDYENHMSLEGVRQLQAMNNIMEQQFNDYDVNSVMVLGVAGGNGLNHVDANKLDRVYGVDINGEYLEAVKQRYSSLGDVLQCIQADITYEYDKLPEADLVIANLLIEYIGYESFRRVLPRVKPSYVSCVIQINTGEDWVSDSPYLHAFDKLELVHHQMDEEILIRTMKQSGYGLLKQSATALPNGKSLVRMDFSLEEK